MGIEASYSSQGGMPVLMIVLIAIFALLLLGTLGRALFIWIRNNNSPKQTVDARVVTKRMKVQGFGRSMNGAGSTMHAGGSTYSRYFVTFELEKGKRIELGVKDSEFGMLAEGDEGVLSFQGTRYLGFEQK